MTLDVFLTNVSNRKDNAHGEAIFGDFEIIKQRFVSDFGVHINVFHKGLILAGQEVNKEVSQHLQNSNLVLLLFSKKFLIAAAKEPLKSEFDQIIEKHNNGSAVVVPIILCKCLWKHTIFKELSPLPTNGKPIENWSRVHDAYFDTAEGIMKVIENIIINSRNNTPQKPNFKIIRGNKYNRGNSNFLQFTIFPQFPPIKYYPT